MSRTAVAAIFLSLALLAVAFSQRRPASEEYPPWEIKTLLPTEYRPARYQHVDDRTIQATAAEGWELVSVTPYAYLNEERGKENTMVTQVYHSYHFKRLKRTNR